MKPFNTVAQMERHLSTLTAQRSRRSQIGEDGRPGWLAYELDSMLVYVNKLRAEQALPPVDRARIVTADELAAGHCDWSYKFALYCAELVAAPG